MNLIDQVYGSFKWKKTDQYCSTKLGISLQKYQEIKKQLLQTKHLTQSEIDSQLVNLAGQRMMELIDDEGEILDRTLDSHMSHLRKNLKALVGTKIKVVIALFFSSVLSLKLFKIGKT